MTSPDAASMPATSSPAETAAALEQGAVVRWWQTTAFLDVTGPEAASFLDGLCTQAVERIEVGHATLGLFLDTKAKIIAPAILHRTAADTILLETLPELVEPLRAHLSKYRLRAKATIEPVELATIAIVGERLDVVTDATWLIVAGQARPTLAYIGTAEDCAELIGSQGHPLADPDAFEADRISRGVASLHDLLPGRMPAEVGGMDTAVALDAGCYLGQEPVARLHYRGHSNRTLRRLESNDPVVPGSPGEADAHLELRPAGESEGRALGRLTTWAQAPDSTIAALAVLRREVAAGTTLSLPGSDALLRVVDDAPA